MKAMQNIPITKIVLLLVGGVASSWLWVWFLGIWAAADTPFLKLLFSYHLSAETASFVSLTLCSLLTAVAFAILLKMSVRRGFYLSSAIFISAFLLMFVVPAFFDNDGFSFVISFVNLWVFVSCYALSVFCASKLRNEASKSASWLQL